MVTLQTDKVNLFWCTRGTQLTFQEPTDNRYADQDEDNRMELEKKKESQGQEEKSYDHN